MNSKILLLSIAVISVGLFAMPSTLSLFAGQHTFDKAGNTTICAKCHDDVLGEIRAGNFHKSLIPAGASGGTECNGCHTANRINATLIYAGNRTQDGSNAKYNYTNYNTLAGLDLANGTFIFANSTNNGTDGNKITLGAAGSLHAAVTVECVWCHGAVNMTNDAHKPLYDNATTQTAGQLRGANAACMGCHTKTFVNMTWVRKGGYDYTFDFRNKSGVLTYNNTNVTTYTNSTS